MLCHGAEGSSWATQLFLAGGLLLLSSTAQAQLTRYVASTGNDANPCTSPAAPCRTLQRGINSAPTGGEVKLLSSVEGDATIDRSITISGGRFTVTGSIVVNNASAAVVLRDLNFFGAGTHDLGVYVIAGSSAHIVRCTVERFTEYGIASEAPDASVFVTDTVSRDNGYRGLDVQDGGLALTRLIVSGSRLLNNGWDGALLHAVAATFIGSSLSGNHGHGVTASNATATFKGTIASGNQIGAGFSLVDTEATLESSTSRGNNGGLEGFTVEETRSVTISNSVFSNNRSYGIFTDGSVGTRGNNTVAGNGTDIDGTLTPLPGM